MPNYDYECQVCGHQFEVFQRMTDPKLEDCPQEGCSGRVKRLLGTGAGVIFKGSGFYQTDYRSKSYRDGDKRETKSDKPADSGAAKAKDGGGKAKAEGAGTSAGGS